MGYSFKSIFGILIAVRKMKLKTVKKYMSLEKSVLIILSIIACVLYFIKIKAAVYMVCGLMIISIGIYFVMALSFWRCPHCHKRLDTYREYKGIISPKLIDTCPDCKEKIIKE